MMIKSIQLICFILMMGFFCPGPIHSMNSFSLAPQSRFIVVEGLTEEENQRVELADTPPVTFMLQEGPLPDVKRPDQDKVSRAYLKFKNQTDDITDEDVEVIIQQAVFEQRLWWIHFLPSEHFALNPLNSFTLALNDGICGVFTEDLRKRIYTLSSGRLDSFYYNSNRVFSEFGGSRNSHAFCMVKYKTLPKIYLLDTSLRQYFSFMGKDPLARYLERKLKEETSRLLQYGYVEFTDLVAQIYCRAVSGQYQQDFSAREMFARGANIPEQMFAEQEDSWYRLHQAVFSRYSPYMGVFAEERKTLIDAYIAANKAGQAA